MQLQVLTDLYNHDDEQSSVAPYAAWNYNNFCTTIQVSRLRNGLETVQDGNFAGSVTKSFIRCQYSRSSDFGFSDNNTSEPEKK